jgi:hypothetical protein
MSVEHSPEHGIPYHLVCYDAHGQERRGKRGLASDDLLDAANRERPSDVFVFSHGWNANPEAALRQYGRWVDTMAARAVDRERLRDRAGGFRPLLSGLHWPSKAWADEELASLSYAAGDDPVADPGSPVTGGPGPAQPAVGDPAERLVTEYADRLGDGLRVRDAIRRIVGSALTDAAPPTLPDDVRAAYEQLDASLQLGHAGEGVAPGDDREPFDAEETYQATLLMDVIDPVSFTGFSLGGVLAPLRVLSFWAMKRRARWFGETGAAGLLGGLQDAASEARFHLAGHSFGCIVASAAVVGAPGSAAPRRGVDTLILMQGAMSLWSFCNKIPARPERGGYFHGLVRDGLVRGPMLVTTSVHDRAVRVFYPLGAGVRGDVAYDTANLPVYGGIGTFGVRGPGIEIEDDQLERVDEQYELRSGVVYNLNADAVIATSAGIHGAHSDICHPELARAVWRAVEGTAAGRNRF